MPKQGNLSQIVVRVKDSTKQSLIEMAADNRRKLSDYIRILIEDEIDKRQKP